MHFEVLVSTYGSPHTFAGNTVHGHWWQGADSKNKLSVGCFSLAPLWACLSCHRLSVCSSSSLWVTASSDIRRKLWSLTCPSGHQSCLCVCQVTVSQISHRKRLDYFIIRAHLPDCYILAFIWFVSNKMRQNRLVSKVLYGAYNCVQSCEDLMARSHKTCFLTLFKKKSRQFN